MIIIVTSSSIRVKPFSLPFFHWHSRSNSQYLFIVSPPLLDSFSASLPKLPLLPISSLRYFRHYLFFFYNTIVLLHKCSYPRFLPLFSLPLTAYFYHLFFGQHKCSDSLFTCHPLPPSYHRNPFLSRGNGRYRQTGEDMGFYGVYCLAKISLLLRLACVEAIFLLRFACSSLGIVTSTPT